MVRNDGAEARRERMEKIARSIYAKFEKGEKILLSVAVAEFQYQFGLSETKILEYLNILQKLGKIALDGKNDLITNPRV